MCAQPHAWPRIPVKVSLIYNGKHTGVDKSQRLGTASWHDGRRPHLAILNATFTIAEGQYIFRDDTPYCYSQIHLPSKKHLLLGPRHLLPMMRRSRYSRISCSEMCTSPPRCYMSSCTLVFVCTHCHGPQRTIDFVRQTPQLDCPVFV